MPSPVPLAPELRRKSLVNVYLTPEQKEAAVRLARAANMTQSDLGRLLFVTCSLDDVERLKRHPAYLAVLMEEATR